MHGSGRGCILRVARPQPGAIEAALTIRMIFRLPLRQTEGFLRSLAGLLGLGPPIPDPTTLSRCPQKLGDLRFRKLAADEPIHLLIDSTGLRVHVGHLRRPPKRGVWRKLHPAIHANTGEVLASDLTIRRTADCTPAPELLDQIDDRVASITADGPCDAGTVYEAAQGKGGERTQAVTVGAKKSRCPQTAVGAGVSGRSRRPLLAPPRGEITSLARFLRRLAKPTWARWSLPLTTVPRWPRPKEDAIGVEGMSPQAPWKLPGSEIGNPSRSLIRKGSKFIRGSHPSPRKFFNLPSPLTGFSSFQG